MTAEITAKRIESIAIRLDGGETAEMFHVQPVAPGIPAFRLIPQTTDTGLSQIVTGYTVLGHFLLGSEPGETLVRYSTGDVEQAVGVGTYAGRTVLTADDFDPPLAPRQVEQVQAWVNNCLRLDRAARGEGTDRS